VIEHEAGEAARLAQIEVEEAELVLAGFDNDDAWALGVQLVEAARADRLAVTISIRRGGQRLFHAALPGTCVDNDYWLERKFRVVALYNAPSFLISTKYRARGQDFNEVTGLPVAEYAAAGGASARPARAAGSRRANRPTGPGAGGPGANVAR
jgi:uncharacterized protein (UPF0303 family)